MGTELTTHQAQQDGVDRALAQLTLSRLWPSDGQRDMAAIERAVTALSKPADPVWLMVRCASLLHPYYEKDAPQSVREMDAEDWAAALRGYPKWAIERAVRWWKSADNERRGKRPLEGDIEAQCEELMDGVRAAQRILASGQAVSTLRLPEAPRERVSPEAAAEIMARAGFPVRRME
jgi:hypothetical protein